MIFEKFPFEENLKKISSGFFVPSLLDHSLFYSPALLPSRSSVGGASHSALCRAIRIGLEMLHTALEIHLLHTLQSPRSRYIF